MEPRVFIGCSTEALKVAEFLQTQLQHIATVQIWNQGFVKGGDYVLERLIKGVREFDFGIFIISPDDLATIRDTNYLVARDNVLFEAGLFFSQLGRKRTLLVAPYKAGSQEIDFHLPSDLNGLTLVKYYAYSNPKDLPAKLGPVTTEIKEIIEEEKKLVDLRIKEIIDSRAVTGGILYLLRHLDVDSRSLGRCIEIMLKYDSLPDPKADEGWEKVARYAAQTLMALGLAEFTHTSTLGYKITEYGKIFLLSPLVLDRYREAMEVPIAVVS